MPPKDLAERLRRLRRAKRESKLENRKELSKEYEEKRENEKVKEELERRREKKEFEEEQRVKLGKVEYERQKGMNYTVEEDEEWNDRVEGDRVKESEQEFQNWAQLAERTYLKKMKNGRVDEEEYAAQKKVYESLKAEGMSEEQIIGRLTDRKRLAAVSEELKKRAEVGLKKSKVSGKGGFINDKNREFNDKLERMYK